MSLEAVEEFGVESLEEVDSVGLKVFFSCKEIVYLCKLKRIEIKKCAIMLMLTRRMGAAVDRLLNS